MSQTQPVFRLIDFAEALSGPFELPRLDLAHLDREADQLLLAIQQRMLLRAWTVQMGPARGPRPSLNCPVSVGDVAEAVLAVAVPFRDLVGDLGRLFAGRAVSDQVTEDTLRDLYCAVLSHVVQDLERRHGAHTPAGTLH